MCRFLLIKSSSQFKPVNYLIAFSNMCKKSRTPDGDKQEDGWGVCWQENNQWQIRKNLKSIWEDQEAFSSIPETNILVVHARSAGFPDQKGNIEYNQPYLSKSLCFVFNGMIQGVRINRPLEGKIGAQKIFSLIKQELKNNSVNQVLKLVDKIILNKSKKIISMNIGLVNNNRFFILNRYSNSDQYFTLWYYQDNNLTAICSQPLSFGDWKKIGNGSVLVI